MQTLLGTDRLARLSSDRNLSDTEEDIQNMLLFGNLLSGTKFKLGTLDGC